MQIRCNLGVYFSPLQYTVSAHVRRAIEALRKIAT